MITLLVVFKHIFYYLNVDGGSEKSVKFNCMNDNKK